MQYGTDVTEEFAASIFRVRDDASQKRSLSGPSPLCEVRSQMID